MKRDNGLTGTHQTKEHIKNRMKTLIKNGLYERMIGNKYCLGHSHTEASKEKMSASQLKTRALLPKEVINKTLLNLDQTGVKHTEEQKRQRSKIAKISCFGKWMIGRKMNDKIKSKISASHKLLYKNGYLNPMLGKRYPENARLKMIGRYRGENSPSWKGGRTKLCLIIRECFRYKEWRRNVFLRDNFICIICGYSKGGILEADHIIRFSDILIKYNIRNIEDALACEQLWDINNGRTLCKSCHKKTETYGGRRKKTTQDCITNGS